MVRRRTIAISLFLAATICVVGCYVMVVQYTERAEIEFISSFEAGNNAAALDAARKIGYVNSWTSNFYLAQLAVANSIGEEDKVRIDKLSKALNRMENSWTIVPGVNHRQYILLMASISAMLGNNVRAKELAEVACRMYRSMNIEKCLNGPITFDDPQGNMWAALQYYEAASLYNSIGEGDKVRAMSYEAVALKYFDIKLANELRSRLVVAGHFDEKMQIIYCNNYSPRDVVACEETEGKRGGFKVHAYYAY